jgi:hypothetical protein
MNLLIPYIKFPNHLDPDLEEYTYGDVRARARTLKEKVRKGDHLFFHTTLGGKKYITAYFIVDRTLDVSVAIKDGNIMRKYKNPHLKRPHGYIQNKGQDDAVVFGDTILSKRLSRPLLFDLKLAGKLALGIRTQGGRTEAQSVGSATRAWRKLSDKDVRRLLREIDREELKPVDAHRILSTDEVTELLEKDLENYIEKSKNIIGKSLRIVSRQEIIPQIGRIDLLCMDEAGTRYVVELKLGHIGRAALNQIQRYMGWVRKQGPGRVKGILVCGGVMPVYEDEIRKAEGIIVLRYGWQMKMSRWP